MAGLLTSRISDTFPARNASGLSPEMEMAQKRPKMVRALSLGFTVAGTVPDLHRLPFSSAAAQRNRKRGEGK